MTRALRIGTRTCALPVLAFALACGCNPSLADVEEAVFAPPLGEGGASDLASAR